MSVELLIASKYLRAKRKRGFLSFISGVSMSGLVLAVIALITVLSVMNGFHKELRQRVLGSISHAYIGYADGVINDWQTAQQKILTTKNLDASAAYIEDYALLTFANNAQGVLVRGIFPEQEKKVSTLLSKIKYGSNSLANNEIILGFGLAQKLNASIGSKITLLTPKLSNSIIGATPKFKRFTVSGIFSAGIADYDNNLAFIAFDSAQKLYQIKGASGIRLKMVDLFQAQTTLENTLKALPRGYYGRTWMQQKSNFFQALQLEKRMIALILALIIAVAAFNVVSMMVMVVTDKRADIAILRTLGLTPKRVVRIFFYQGLMIGIIGIIIGTLLGILLTLNIESVIATIESLLGFQFFPADVFYISRFPSDLQLNDVLWVIGFALLLVLLASIYPAIRAGKTNIVQTLHHE